MSQFRNKEPSKSSNYRDHPKTVTEMREQKDAECVALQAIEDRLVYDIECEGFRRVVAVRRYPSHFEMKSSKLKYDYEEIIVYLTYVKKVLDLLECSLARSEYGDSLHERFTSFSAADINLENMTIPHEGVVERPVNCTEAVGNPSKIRKVSNDAELLSLGIGWFIDKFDAV